MLWKRFLGRTAVAAVLAASPLSFSMLAAAEFRTPAGVLVPAGRTGGDLLAIILKADELPAGITAHDHVILIDTSASQVGQHRQQSLGVLRKVLATLPAGDRVRLFAVDVQTEPLTADFVAPQGSEILESLATLDQRVPLGATNLPKAYEAALSALPADRAGSITYIGDGVSSSAPIPAASLRTLIGELQSRQIMAHGYAVGPQQNLHLLGALAHQTGGILLFDGTRDDQSPDQDGQALGAAIAAPVFLPTEMKAPRGLTLFNDRALPVRLDRETILVARGNLQGDASFELSDGKGNSASWTLAAPQESRDVQFLPAFAERLELDGGLSNSLAGLPVVRAAQQEFDGRLNALLQAGEQALAGKHVREARQIASTVAQLDPQNELATSLEADAQRLEARLVSRQTETEDPKSLENRVSPDPADSPIAEQDQLRVVLTQKLRYQVANAVEAARRSTEPEQAIDELKRTLNAVKSASDIAPEDRNGLLKRLESELQALQNRSEKLQQQQARRQVALAAEEAQNRITDQLLLEEEKLANLIDRVRALMEDGRHGDDPAFGEAAEVAQVAIDLRPDSGVSSAARFGAIAAQQLTRSFRLRTLRANEFLETLHQVELSHVPFPDEPPIRFPPAEVWKSLSERRKKWDSVDLKKNSPNEQRILKALSEETEVDFVDMPLKEAIDFLKNYHDIQIWADEVKLTDAGIGIDTPVTLQLTKITLRSALKLLLEPQGLTYVIEDEVMKITTIEEADLKLSVRVYPVADLVVPITGGSSTQGGGQNGISGSPFGGSAGGGGGMGGMGGGMGGMGGGMGGGFFSVPPLPAAGQPVDLGKKKQ